MPQSDLSKFGPWGGKGGGATDIEMAPNRLESITIRCGATIDSIEFSYTDYEGQYHTCRLGGLGGRKHMVSVKRITLPIQMQNEYY